MLYMGQSISGSYGIVVDTFGIPNDTRGRSIQIRASFTFLLICEARNASRFATESTVSEMTAKGAY